MARPQKSESEVEAFRETAAAAALAMVEEEGVASLTLRRLAKRLGCSYAKPYSYYRDKAHLVDAVRGQAFDRLAEHMRSSPNLGERPVGMPYFRFAFENPEAFRIMFELRQDFVSEETRAAQQRAWAACTAPFHELVESGALVGDPELIAHVAWVSFHGLASLALANQLHLGKAFEEVANGLESILRGFAPGADALPVPTSD